jgi:electron transport complex protein RnfB
VNAAAPPFEPKAPAPEVPATPTTGVASLLPPDSARGAEAVRLLADRLDALLPQTQCTRCGYPDCRAYAEALAAGEAAVNHCPPGGAEGVRRLADALGLPALPLNPANGVEGPRQVVFIEEHLCIGCTLCIQACPVDAIIGAPKHMHAVIEPLCTGCELCVPACPVDCIVLENASGTATGWDAWSPALAEEAHMRYAAHRERLEREERAEDERLAARTARQAPADVARPELAQTSSPAALPASSPAATTDPKRAAIEAALARARARMGQEKPR